MEITEEDLKSPQVYLAKVRTDLARERTVLAYIHMAFSLVIGGLALFGFSEHAWWFQHVGMVCIVFGGVLLFIGGSYYFRNDSQLKAMIRKK